jgi:hypothetical protein
MRNSRAANLQRGYDNSRRMSTSPKLSKANDKRFVTSLNARSIDRGVVYPGQSFCDNLKHPQKTSVI